MCMSVTWMYLYVLCVWLVLSEVEIDVKSAGTGNWTLVLYKGSKCSYLAELSLQLLLSDFYSGLDIIGKNILQVLRILIIFLNAELSFYEIKILLGTKDCVCVSLCCACMCVYMRVYVSVCLSVYLCASINASSCASVCVYTLLICMTWFYLFWRTIDNALVVSLLGRWDWIFVVV